MDKEDIIRMAKESGAARLHNRGNIIFGLDALEHFAALIAAEERERILDMCKEGLWDGEGIKFHLEKRGQG